MLLPVSGGDAPVSNPGPPVGSANPRKSLSRRSQTAAPACRATRELPSQSGLPTCYVPISSSGVQINGASTLPEQRRPVTLRDQRSGDSRRQHSRFSSTVKQVEEPEFRDRIRIPRTKALAENSDDQVPNNPQIPILSPPPNSLLSGLWDLVLRVLEFVVSLLAFLAILSRNPGPADRLTGRAR